MSSLSPESTISHYKIKELIGRGGMGEIYKAVDVELGRVVVIKTLSPALIADQTAQQRFLREARAASILSHPGICTVFEVGKDGDLVFIAMQYLQGKTIQELLARGPMPIESAVSYALDIAEALEEAHKNGVIHRDIKPSNIIVNERGSAVVLDFGLAKQVTSFSGALADESPTMMHVTTAASIIGTAPYMSPEQVRGEAVDARSDIFSFGSTLYEMLSGVRPFDGRSQIETMHAILHAAPKPLSKLRREVGRELERIVTRALKKEPVDRYDSVHDLKLELVEYIQSKGLQLRSVSTRPPADNSSTILKTRILPSASFASRATSRASRILAPRVRLPVAAIVLIALAIAGAVWWFLVRNRSAQEANPFSSLHFVQLANWKNEADEGVNSVLSRDGKLIAFSSMGGGVRNLWIKQTISGDTNPIQITRDEWDKTNPIFSPDGTRIAFKSNRGRKFGIWLMPAFGGTPTLLKQVDSEEFTLEYWSKDGQAIYFLNHDKSWETDLLALDVASGSTTLTNRFSQLVTELSFSQNEDRIAYAASQDGQKDLWLWPTAGGSPVRVTNDSAIDRHPAWLPDGKRIIYNSERDGVFQMCVAYLDGRTPVQVTFGESSVFVHDVSLDGTKVLYQSLKEESDIWGVRLDTGEERALASDANVKFWPDVSPDGKTIAFQSVRNVGQEVEVRKSKILTRATETEGQQIELVVDGIQPLWSPDGEYVAFLRASNYPWNLWTVKSTGGDERQLTTEGIDMAYTTGPYNRTLPRRYSWSRDSKKVVYCTPAEGSGVYVTPIDGSGELKSLVERNPDLKLTCPLFSTDDRRIAYLSESRSTLADGNHAWSIWVLDTQTSRTEIVFQKNTFIRLIGWSGDNIVAGVSEGDTFQEPRPIRLFQISSAGGRVIDIAQLRSAYLYNSFLSPDGRFLAVPLREDGKDNIWLIPVNSGQRKRVTSNNDPKQYFSSMAWSPDGRAIYYGKQSTKTLISMIDNFR